MVFYWIYDRICGSRYQFFIFHHPFHLIDPSLIDVLKDRTIESTESFLQKLNAPEEKKIQKQ